MNVMGEQKLRMLDGGLKMKPLQPGQQMPITPEMMRNAKQRECACGCKYFVPAVMVQSISALVSPTGQELVVQHPVLVCLECRTALNAAE